MWLCGYVAMWLPFMQKVLVWKTRCEMRKLKIDYRCGNRAKIIKTILRVETARVDRAWFNINEFRRIQNKFGKFKLMLANLHKLKVI